MENGRSLLLQVVKQNFGAEPTSYFLCNASQINDDAVMPLAANAFDTMMVAMA